MTTANDQKAAVSPLGEAVVHGAHATVGAPGVGKSWRLMTRDLPNFLPEPVILDCDLRVAGETVLLTGMTHNTTDQLIGKYLIGGPKDGAEDLNALCQDLEGDADTLREVLKQGLEHKDRRALPPRLKSLRLGTIFSLIHADYRVVLQERGVSQLYHGVAKNLVADDEDLRDPHKEWVANRPSAKAQAVPRSIRKIHADIRGYSGGPIDPELLDARDKSLRFDQSLLHYLQLTEGMEPERNRYGTVMLDEAQDAEPLHVLALVRFCNLNGYRLHVYGDPNQAIFLAFEHPMAFHLAEQEHEFIHASRFHARLPTLHGDLARALFPEMPETDLWCNYSEGRIQVVPDDSIELPEDGMYLFGSRTGAGRGIDLYGATVSEDLPLFNSADWKPMVDDRVPEAALLKERSSPPLYTTGHNAKGYEAMTVQLARWTNHGRKPLKRLKEAQLPERRLVYTMLTRSRETLVIPESLWEALGECCEVLGTTLPKPHAS